MMIIQHSEKEKFSYADYFTWNDDQRWELINGEPLLMSPAPNRIHQTVLEKIGYQIESYMQGKTCELFLPRSMSDWKPPEPVTKMYFMWFNHILW